MPTDNTAPRLSLAPEARPAAATIRYFRIPDFDKLQHYKNRNPPWVKLYRELILDYEFQQYDEVTRFHGIALLILASASGNKIPNDPRWVAGQIGAHAPVDLARLYEAGLLEPWQPRLQEPGPGEQLELPDAPDDASNPASTLLARRASAETDTEQSRAEAHADTATAGAERRCVQCGAGVCSEFSLAEATTLMKRWKAEGRLVGGRPIENVYGLAHTVHHAGTADDELRLLLHPPPRREFTEEACPSCFGTKLQTVEGKGARPCPDCVDETGRRTGRRPKDAPAGRSP